MREARPLGPQRFARSFGVAFVLASVLADADAVADSSRYEQIRVDAGITGSSVSVGDRSGTGMVVEIKNQLTDTVAIGGRVEIAVMFGGVVGEDELPLDIAMAACGLLKVELHPLDGPVRPFVALGAGGYTIGGQTIDGGPHTSGIRRETGRYVGVAPQVGVDLGPFRLAATYNAILGASLEVSQMVGDVRETTKLSQNYLSLELSFRFAGGPRRAAPPPPAPPPPTAPPGLSGTYALR